MHRSTPNILELFPSPQGSRGDMPSDYEMAVMWRAKRYELIRTAQYAEQFAYSHRQARPNRHSTAIAKYGCAVLGCRPGLIADEQFLVTSGWNFKLLPGDSMWTRYHPVDHYKLCSEPDAVIQALWQHCRQIYGLALFSNNMQAEDVSGKFCNIQHPCAACRGFLDSFLPDWAPVLLVRNRLPCDLHGDSRTEFIDDLIIEDWTMGEIRKHHTTGRPP
jgi:cytidine deaminase